MRTCQAFRHILDLLVVFESLNDLFQFLISFVFFGPDDSLRVFFVAAPGHLSESTNARMIMKALFYVENFQL